MNFMSLDFINSSWYDSHRGYEALTNSKWLGSFKVKYNIKLDGIPDSISESELIELRGLLANILGEVKAGSRLSEKAVNTLNHHLSLSKYSRRIFDTDEGYELVEVPENQDWQWVEAEIAASFIELISNYDIERIKYCENRECNWVFYDESKSRTRRWCNDTCASLMKVRRFRERKRNK